LIEQFRLPSETLDELARGYGGPAAIHMLRQAQVSRRRLMLLALVDNAGSESVETAYRLLVDAETMDPAAVRHVLTEPHVGSWLATSLRRIRSTGGRNRSDIEHLAVVAATAAIRAGLDFEIDVSPQSGWVCLPGYGAARVCDRQRVTVKRDNDGLRVGDVAAPEDFRTSAADWFGLRRMSATVDGLRISLDLDDIDVYRDCHDYGAAPRLSHDAAAHWQGLLAQAWTVLVTSHRTYAEGIATGLRNLVPLTSPNTHQGVNVTSMDSFGSVSMTLPVDELAFAVALIHEFQHAKLGAVTDMYPLFDGGDDDRALYYAPWREDPRPLGKLLHGIYAFQSVSDFWRDQAGLLSAERAALAQVEYVRWRDQVWQALQVLEDSGRCTPIGRRFLAGMRATQSAWRADDVPPSAAELAAEAAADHRIAWRLRNRHPAANQISELARAWMAGAEPPDTVVSAAVEPAPERHLSKNPRMDLIRLRIADPARFSADLAPNASEGDQAYARGDFVAAGAAYAREIGADPDRTSAWVGLALASTRAENSVRSPLREIPEVVSAVYRELHGNGSAPDPIGLARWMVHVCVR